MAAPSVAAGIKGQPSSYLGRMLQPYPKHHLSFTDQIVPPSPSATAVFPTRW